MPRVRWRTRCCRGSLELARGGFRATATQWVRNGTENRTPLLTPNRRNVKISSLRHWQYVAFSIHGNQLRFAFKEIPATFVRKCEWTRRKEDGMTVELEEFTKWRGSVEARLGRLEVVSDEHAGKTTHHEGLLGSVDADLSQIQVEFRAQRGMLQALHITQNEHTAALRKLETGQEELRRGQGELWQGQEELRQGQVEVLAGVQAIIGLLGRDIDGGAEPSAS
jgi:hypothetical protein